MRLVSHGGLLQYFQRTFFWTRIRTSDDVWRMLVRRRDHQIGFQEFLAVLLAWATFSNCLQGSLWRSFVENDSVLHAVTNGSGGNTDTSLCIGRLWLELAAAGVDLHMGRADSVANVADGPHKRSLQSVGLIESHLGSPKAPALAAHTLGHFWYGVTTKCSGIASCAVGAAH